MGNTFVNNSSYQGRLKESTQLGAELLGDASPEADAEMIAMVIELLLDAGLKEFQVSIGQIDFFKGFLLAAGLDEEQEFTLRELISNKNNFGIEEFLDDIRMPKTCREAFIRMPQLFGNAEVLKEARRLADNSRSIGAIERLEAVYHALKLYDLTDYISFDLGLVSKYKYYTGVIFQAYTYGTGEPIVKGGRYDNLLARFGKDFAATGFAVVIDQLMSALSRQKIAIPVEADGRLVLYDASSRDAAIHLAVSMRKDGRPVELVRKTAGETAEDYRDFAAENGHGKIYDLTAEGVKEADV